MSKLTIELDMEIDEDLLWQKYEASSQEKNEIYRQRRGKLNDIMKEIKFYEQRIK